jgi:UPF0755 protein
VKRKKVFGVFLCLLLILGIAGAAGFAYYLLTPAKTGDQDRIVLVQEGSSLREVARKLETDGLTTNRHLFVISARLLGCGRTLKAGEYRLNPGMPPLQILKILDKGRAITHAVTIPEGYTRRQIAEVLAARGLADKNKFLTLTGSPETAAHWGLSAPSLEGYLYPDTYYLGRGLSPAAIVEIMVKRFKEVFQSFRERARQVGMPVEKIIILASIVEKETGRARERPLIASVFLNRLRKGIRLESDPTVIYGLKEFNGNLTRRHLDQPTPYNTYLIRGLPPGPIANPGRESIKAVLYPARTHYLYFVSKNDGSHHFSRTLSEHNRAVRRYQKTKRKKG